MKTVKRAIATIMAIALLLPTMALNAAPQPCIHIKEGYFEIWGIRDENGILTQHRVFYPYFNANFREQAQNSDEWIQIVTRGGSPRLDLLFSIPLYRTLTQQELRQFITMYDALGGATERELSELNTVNRLREENNRNRLEINRYMMIAARLKTYYMMIWARLGDHDTGPYGLNTESASGYINAVISGHMGAGNSAQGSGAFAWYNSMRGHREYMLRPNATHFGIGFRGNFSYLFVGGDTPVSPVTLYEANRLQEQGISRQEILGEHYLQVMITEAYRRYLAGRSFIEGDIELLVMNLDDARLIRFMEGMRPGSMWLRDYWSRIVRGSGTQEDISVIFEGNPRERFLPTTMPTDNQRLAMELFLTYRLPYLTWE